MRQHNILINKLLTFKLLLLIPLFISACTLGTKTTPAAQDKNDKLDRSVVITDSPVSATVTTTPTLKPENKLCDWVDNSDIQINLTFADGVDKDTSYEAGFYYSAIASNMRLARSQCNYRTGFSFEEMKNKGVVQVGVRGFSDSNRRKLENEPISIIFDENGKPTVPSIINVKVLNQLTLIKSSVNL